MSPQDDGLPLPFSSGARLTVSGRWGEGGLALIRSERRERRVALPPALFALLATLILKARRDQDASLGGFASVRELCALLKQYTRQTDNPLDPDSQHLIKYVFRLRRALGEDGLIEHERYLGYRVSTPPRNLVLRIASDPPRPVPGICNE